MNKILNEMLDLAGINEAEEEKSNVTAGQAEMTSSVWSTIPNNIKEVYRYYRKYNKEVTFVEFLGKFTMFVSGLPSSGKTPEGVARKMSSVEAPVEDEA